LGKAFKKDAKSITDKLAGLSIDELINLDNSLKTNG